MKGFDRLAMRTVAQAAIREYAIDIEHHQSDFLRTFHRQLLCTGIH
jgi:hypothetical protein